MARHRRAARTGERVQHQLTRAAERLDQGTQGADRLLRGMESVAAVLPGQMVVVLYER